MELCKHVVEVKLISPYSTKRVMGFFVPATERWRRLDIFFFFLSTFSNLHLQQAVVQKMEDVVSCLHYHAASVSFSRQIWLQQPNANFSKYACAAMRPRTVLVSCLYRTEKLSASLHTPTSLLLALF